jgi:hypothetical protein
MYLLYGDFFFALYKLNNQSINQSMFDPVSCMTGSPRLKESPDCLATPFYHRGDTTSQTLRMPTAYVITPTYARATQKPDLLRMCYTLTLAPHVHWIVVEDSPNRTADVSDHHAQSITYSKFIIGQLDTDSVKTVLSGHRGKSA